MIHPEDSEFHPNDPSLTRWAETIGFWFAIPEERIYGNIYVQARPNVGATISSINVVQGNNPDPYRVDFTDPHVHVPCPPSMAKFSLENGLSVDAYSAPNCYRFSYNSLAGVCSMDLDLRGSMAASDPNDPAENPLVRKDADKHSDLGLGDAWAGGHLDFLGRVTGSLTLRGRSYEVEAMGGLDRSWGSRTELGQAAISYVHIPFDEDFGIHFVVGAELEGDDVAYGPLRFGYIYEKGKVYGITDVTMDGSHVNLLPTGNHIAVTDERGHTFEMYGTSIASAPWYTFSPSYATFQSLMRYELDEKVGHGLMADVWGIEFLAARTSRHGKAALSTAASDA